MASKESRLISEILIAAGEEGHVLYRNETGTFWGGSVVYQQGDEIVLRGARRVSAGLCRGSADLVGYTSDGRFLAVEVKTGRVRVTREQLAFLGAVRMRGGVAGVARSVDDLRRILEGEILV